MMALAAAGHWPSLTRVTLVTEVFVPWFWAVAVSVKQLNTRISWIDGFQMCSHSQSSWQKSASEKTLSKMSQKADLRVVLWHSMVMIKKKCVRARARVFVYVNVCWQDKSKLTHPSSG